MDGEERKGRCKNGEEKGSRDEEEGKEGCLPLAFIFYFLSSERGEARALLCNEIEMEREGTLIMARYSIKILAVNLANILRMW